VLSRLLSKSGSTALVSTFCIDVKWLKISTISAGLSGHQLRYFYKRNRNRTWPNPLVSLTTFHHNFPQLWFWFTLSAIRTSCSRLALLTWSLTTLRCFLKASHWAGLLVWTAILWSFFLLADFRSHPQLVSSSKSFYTLWGINSEIMSHTWLDHFNTISLKSIDSIHTTMHQHR
jgi:hypothetical protein